MKLCYNKWRNSKYRAKRAKIPFSLTRAEAYQIFIDQRGRCALTGKKITIATTKQEWRERLPNHGSMDRIDSDGGYTRDNVQWTLVSANQAKGSFHDEEFVEMCKAVVKYHGWRRFFRR